MQKLIGFIFVFLIIQNILTTIEIPWYIGNLVSDIEGGRTRMVRNGILSYDFIKGSLGYFFFYFFVLLSFYYIIIKPRASLVNAFILGSAIDAVIAASLMAMFSRANHTHLPVLLYDIFIVGGFAYSLSLYIWNTYPNILSSYWFFFLVLFFITVPIYAYAIYKVETTPYAPEKLKQTAETK